MTDRAQIRVFDADQHYYEPLDAFTRHLPAGWGERTVQQAVIDGRVRFIVGGRVNTTISNPTFDPIVKPGAMMDYFRGNPHQVKLADCLKQREPLPDYYRDRDARIRKMDEQGVDATWLLPTTCPRPASTASVAAAVSVTRSVTGVDGVVNASMACSVFGGGRSGYGNAACALGTAALPGMMWEDTVRPADQPDGQVPAAIGDYAPAAIGDHTEGAMRS